ncbi:MAG TPA: hypothetical protein VMU83_01670 [Hanamia sp.]|nr:hypothetical protein [Hanamia sp.]
MRNTILLSILVFYGFSAFCQDSYLTLDGNKIDGTIENNKDWSKNPTSVIFKVGNNGNTISLTPENCEGFTAGPDKYISYHGTRVANNDDVLNNNTQDNDQLIKDTVNVFLRLIYQDKNYTLYELRDSKRANFYLSDNGKIKELEYYETLNSSEMVPYNLYKVYLYQLFSKKNIPGFKGKLKNLNYKENNLIDFFAYILGDKSHSKENLRDKYPSEILVGLGANVNFGTLITDLNASYLTNLHHTDFSPSFEIGFRIHSQRNFGKFFLQPSISVTQFSNTFHASSPPGFVMKTKDFMVNVNLGAGYIFVKKPDFSLYADAAIAFPILFNYQTEQGIDSLYTAKDMTEIRVTLHPEVGVIINRTLNISLSSLLPFNLPYLLNPAFGYKQSQVSLALRYSFIHKRR